MDGSWWDGVQDDGDESTSKRVPRGSAAAAPRSLPQSFGRRATGQELDFLLEFGSLDSDQYFPLDRLLPSTT